MRRYRSGARQPSVVLRLQKRERVLVECSLPRHGFVLPGCELRALAQPAVPSQKAFWPYGCVQCGYTRKVGTRPIQASDKSKLDWIGASKEDYRNGCRCGLRCECRRAISDNHAGLATQQIADKRWQSIITSLSPAIFNDHIVVVVVTDLV